MHEAVFAQVDENLVRHARVRHHLLVEGCFFVGVHGTHINLDSQPVYNSFPTRFLLRLGFFVEEI